MKNDIFARKCLGWVMTFLGGFVVCANLTHLVEINSNYEASWGKVVFSFAMAIMGGVLFLRSND